MNQSNQSQLINRSINQSMCVSDRDVDRGHVCDVYIALFPDPRRPSASALLRSRRHIGGHRDRRPSSLDVGKVSIGSASMRHTIDLLTAQRFSTSLSRTSVPDSSGRALRRQIAVSSMRRLRRLHRTQSVQPRTECAHDCAAVRRMPSYSLPRSSSTTLLAGTCALCQHGAPSRTGAHAWTVHACKLASSLIGLRFSQAQVPKKKTENEPALLALCLVSSL